MIPLKTFAIGVAAFIPAVYVINSIGVDTIVVGIIKLLFNL